MIRRAALGVVTLVLLSILVFAAARVLPGDVGRAVLGPLADARAVAALDHELGADRGAVAAYAAWARGAVRGDFGVSLQQRRPVAGMVRDALGRSLLLACVILGLTVPAAVAAGVAAAWQAGGALDRGLMLGGLAFTVVPEFVTAIVAMLGFGIWLGWLPISAGGRIDPLHLALPALPVMLALFGYLARLTRAVTLGIFARGFIQAALLRGLPPAFVAVQHLLPAVLPPVLTVVAAQLGYLVGGLVVVETLFRYPGIGFLILSAARSHDFPVLQAAVLVIGAIVIGAALLADGLARWLAR